MSIGVAKYDMVVVSKPSMAVVRIGAGYAHTRDGRRGAGDGRGARARARARVVEGGGGSRGEARLVATVGGAEKLGMTGGAEWVSLGQGRHSGEGLGDGDVADADADASAAEGAKPAERAHQTILL
jgi:hypothetical protein